MDRRAFMTLTGAAALTGSAVVAQPSRRWVSVGGKPARVVDIHGHCAFREVQTLVAGTPLARTIPELLILGPRRIAELDRRGIDVQILSVNGYWWYAADEALAAKIVQTHDEGLAGLCAAYTGRLGALSSVALQFPELAARQVEHAVRELGLKGASIGGHVAGEMPTTARFDPFWAKCQELDVPIFMHPDSASNIVRDGAWAGRGDLGNIMGNPLETTFFLTRMMFDGVFDRFPRLKICAAHGGGYLPAYLGRTEAACAYRPTADCVNKKAPSAYLKDQVFVDSMVFSDSALRGLVEVMGAGHVTYGSDIPYSWPDTIDLIAGASWLTDADKRAMLGGNAVRLLRLA